MIRRSRPISPPHLPDLFLSTIYPPLFPLPPGTAL
jgi:hypothetical protein